MSTLPYAEATLAWLHIRVLATGVEGGGDGVDDVRHLGAVLVGGIDPHKGFGEPLELQAPPHHVDRLVSCAGAGGAGGGGQANVGEYG